ncbi:hypothetical protein [Serratia sp. PL7]|uniref:hypothetical protein n=1 Tax=Serratia sp. PL7 TaxID=2952201 RepID=UPI001A0CDB29|nr:hypothetical protein [Serratia sp. PL7]MBE0148302.1 hypothetical protein [Serratia fonticola]
MLERYFAHDTSDQERRLLAVQAALEIAKASVGNWHGSEYSRVDDDLQTVKKELVGLADEIQAALEFDEE